MILKYTPQKRIDLVESILAIMGKAGADLLKEVSRQVQTLPRMRLIAHFRDYRDPEDESLIDVEKYDNKLSDFAFYAICFRELTQIADEPTRAGNAEATRILMMYFSETFIAKVTCVKEGFQFNTAKVSNAFAKLRESDKQMSKSRQEVFKQYAEEDASKLKDALAFPHHEDRMFAILMFTILNKAFDLIDYAELLTDPITKEIYWLNMNKDLVKHAESLQAEEKMSDQQKFVSLWSYIESYETKLKLRNPDATLLEVLREKILNNETYSTYAKKLKDAGYDVIHKEKLPKAFSVDQISTVAPKGVNKATLHISQSLYGITNANAAPKKENRRLDVIKRL